MALINGNWEKRYCALRDGHLRTYKSQEDTIEESDVRMRHVQLKEFQGEPDRQMCFSLNGCVFRAEDDYDLVEWVFAINGAIQYCAIMQKVKDAINSVRNHYVPFSITWQCADHLCCAEQNRPRHSAEAHALAAPCGGRADCLPSQWHVSAP
jgi:hypothetical protein